MSEKGKSRRALREAKQEQHANKVVKWICGILIAMAILLMIYSMMLQ